MSEGPIKRERLARTVAPIPRLRAGDIVIVITSRGPRNPWRVVSTDGVIALLEDAHGMSTQKVKRYVRSLEKVA